MLPVVSLRTIGEHAVRCRQLLRRLLVHLHVAQGRGIIVGLRIHRRPVEPFMVAGAKQEDPLVRLLRIERHIGRSRHIARIIVTCMGHEECCHTPTVRTHPVKGQKTVHLLTEPLGIAIIEPVRLCGRPHNGFPCLSVTRIHHQYNC